jgi:uncharacterized protein (TIGR02466 family)
MNKLHILPQYIYSFQAPPKLVTKTLHLLRDEEYVKNEHNLHTHVLHERKEYNKLKGWFNQCLRECLDDLKTIQFISDIKVCLMWGNKSEYCDWHHTHSHPQSILSGILYLTDNDSRTWFSIRNIWTNFSYNTEEQWPRNFPSIFAGKGTKNSNDVIHKEPTKSGHLLIFPSHLMHSVDENMSQNTRYSVSFNSFFSGQVGNENSLSKVVFE